MTRIMNEQIANSRYGIIYILRVYILHNRSYDNFYVQEKSPQNASYVIYFEKKTVDFFMIQIVSLYQRKEYLYHIY